MHSDVTTFGSDSSVGIATGYDLHGRGVGVRVPVEATIFSSPCRPDWFWEPLNLLSNGYRELFLRGSSAQCVKLTTHLELAPR
jgi:hypothetical protein